MTLLEFFFIISGIIIFFIALDVSKKQKFNALHFLVFLGVGIGLLIFTFFPNILSTIGSIFGVARGADVLVYASIIFLIYFVLLLLSKYIQNKDDITNLIRELALENSEKKIVDGEILFLVRVYNEDKVVEKTINSILDSGYKNILVVNDGSTDKSKKILKNFGNKIILINHLKNRGGGAALETGFEYIRRYGKTKYVCTFDADGQHDINDLKIFINTLNRNKNIEVVLGSRFIKNTNTNVGFVRKIVLKLGILFTFFISNIKLTDSHNGYRVFRTDIIDKIKLTIDDMAYASEMLDIIAYNKIKFIEVPVNIHYSKYSLEKGQKSSNAINIALRIIWNKFMR